MIAVRIKLRGFVILFVHKYLSLFGLPSLNYECEKFKFAYSILGEIYALSANCFFIILAAYLSWFGVRTINLYSNNTLTSIFKQLNSFIRFSCIAWTILRRRKQMQHFKQFSYNLRVLKKRLFNKKLHKNSLKLRRFDIIFLLKFFMTCSHSSTLIIGVNNLKRHQNLSTVLLSVYFYIMSLLVSFVLFQYFDALWTLCKYFTILNFNLQQMLRKLKILQRNFGKNFNFVVSMRLASSELKNIHYLHSRLTDLVRNLNDYFKSQIVGILLAYIFYTTLFGYYCVVVADGKVFGPQDSLASAVRGSLSCFVLIADIYLFFYVCDTTMRAQQFAGDVLKEFIIFSRAGCEFNRQCDAFSWELTANKKSIRIAGMFTLSKEDFTAFLSFILMQIVILVQFDFENRMRKAMGKETL